VERLWTDLACADPAPANLAIEALAGAPKQAVALLSKQLHPAAHPEGVARLIADLDSPRFAVRQKALAELQRLGESAEASLRRALADRPNLEVRRRIES